MRLLKILVEPIRLEGELCVLWCLSLEWAKGNHIVVVSNKVGEDSKTCLGKVDLRVQKWLLNPFLVGGKEGFSWCLGEVP